MGSLAERFRFASFQVISIMGTTGFVNTLDYDKWSTAAKLALVMVMLIGGCIGSTAGGIKVGRLLVDLKYAYNELRHMLHPHAVMSVRLGRARVQEEILRPMLFYSFFYLATWLAYLWSWPWSPPAIRGWICRSWPPELPPAWAAWARALASSPLTGRKCRQPAR